MSQAVEIDITDISELTVALGAARVLKAKDIAIRGGGTWVEVKRGGRMGDVVFRVDAIVRPLRGGRRVVARVDGQEIIIEPYVGAGPSTAYVILRLTF